jgi:hypothetical protein
LPAGISDTGQSSSTPHGVDPALWRQLNAELDRVLAASGAARRVSKAPAGIGSSVPDLSMHLEGADLHLTWSYRQSGDCDLNGMVSQSDLVPIGIHFGKSALAADWQKAQLADCDGNGVVNIADVSALGQNFGGQISGYELRQRTDASQPWVVLAERTFSPGVPTTGQYPVYDVTGHMSLLGYEYSVFPYYAGGTQREYGPGGNINSPASDLRNHWATASANNYRDEAVGVNGPADAGTVWQYTLAGASELNILCEPVTDGTGTVYFGTASSGLVTQLTPGWMYAVTTAGKLRWRRATVSGVAMSAAVDALGRVVFADMSGMVYCCAPDGKQLWRRQLSGVGYMSGILLDDLGSSYVVVQIISADALVGSTLYKLNSAGAIVWSRDLGAVCRAAPFYNGVGDITVVNRNSELHSFNDQGVLTYNFMLPEPVVDNYYARTIASRGVGMFYATNTNHGRVVTYDNSITYLVDLAGAARSGPALSSSNKVAFSVIDTATKAAKLKYYSSTNLEWEINLAGVCLNTAVDTSDKMYLGTIAGDSGPYTANSVLCVLPDQTIAWTYPVGQAYIGSVTLAEDGLLVCTLINGEGLQLIGIRAE